MKQVRGIFRFGVLVVGIVTILFFQNCGKAGVESQLSATSLKGESSILSQENPSETHCKIFVGGRDTGKTANSGVKVSRYLTSKSLDCSNSEMSPKEDKTCNGNGDILNFSAGYSFEGCESLQKTQLIHYVRIIYNGILLKVLKSTYSSISQKWTSAVVWDKNKKTGAPGFSASQIVKETIPDRLKLPFLCEQGNICPSGTAPLKEIVTALEPLGQYVESVIDLSNVEYATDAKNMSAYDYALMNPDVTFYLANKYITDSFPANPWLKSPCKDLPTKNGSIDWDAVSKNANQTEIAQKCSYDTVYAVFGDKNLDGTAIDRDSQAWNDRVVFSKNFTTNRFGSEYKLFLDHYNNYGGNPQYNEYRNPNFFFDEAAYYYQYFYPTCTVELLAKKPAGDIIDCTIGGFQMKSGDAFRHYVNHGINSSSQVAYPVIPRFDEVRYLQDNANEDVLKSVYIHTLNPANKNNFENGSLHYIRWGRGELRRAYYLKQSAY